MDIVSSDVIFATAALLLAIARVIAEIRKFKMRKSERRPPQTE
jgi:hypothetical protein